MRLIVKKTETLEGSITIPGSKSQTIRGLIFGLLAKGKSELNGAVDCEDSRTAMAVCQALGAEISLESEQLIIKGRGTNLKSGVLKINTGNSGITTSFIMPLLGLRSDFDTPVILDCEPQMKSRPIASLINALNNLGLEVICLDKPGCLPVSVRDRLVGGRTKIDGITSQYLSALLMALPLSEQDSEIEVLDLKERPYVEMTLGWLKEQKVNFVHEQTNGIDIFKLKGGHQYQAFSKQIGGDFSSASCPIVAATLISGQAELLGLDTNDLQGDKQLINILNGMGAQIKIVDNKLIIDGGKKLIGRNIDCRDIPDLVPALAVVGTQAEGETQLLNVSHVRIKETDRLNSMSQGLGAMGAYVRTTESGLILKKSFLRGAKVPGWGDHRTVMALAVAGLLAQGETEIDSAESINKTFPQFVDLMKSLGGEMSLIN